MSKYHKVQRQTPNLAPSITRVLNMDTETLMGHYGLIKLKKSSLSSTQRRRVTARMLHLINKEKVKQEQIDELLTKLKKAKS